MNTLNIIKMLCKQKGTSLKALERELGFSNGSLAKSETIKADRLQKIADYFNVTIDYLMTGELKRTYLEGEEVSLLITLAEEKGYEVNESLNADMGVTLTIKAPNQEQSVDLRNHEIKELIKKMKDFALESMESMINQKYENGEYHRELTGEELALFVFGANRSKEDNLAELSTYEDAFKVASTYEDAEIVSFVRKLGELSRSELNAAHTRTDVTPTSEDILHDEDIMDDDDF